PTHTSEPSCAVPAALSPKQIAWPSVCTPRPMYVGSAVGLFTFAALKPKLNVPGPPVTVPLNIDSVQSPSNKRSPTRYTVFGFAGSTATAMSYQPCWPIANMGGSPETP